MDDRRRQAHALHIRPAPDPRLSRSVEYGLAMLECFSSDGPPALGIADLAKMIGINRSTTHRYASTLVMLGMLEQDNKHKYRLSVRAAEPGIAAIGAMRMQMSVRKVLEDLREQTGHTVSIAVLDGTRAIYVHRLLGHRAGQHEADLGMGVGASLPLHCTALGKVLVASLNDSERSDLIASLELGRHGPNSITDSKRLSAELDQVREQGLAISDEEQAHGVRAIAVPVGGPEHKPLALDVTVPAAACGALQLREAIGPLIRKAGNQIRLIDTQL